MKLECPVCQASLEHERTDDGTIINKINADGTFGEILNKSNGSDTVRCSANSSHDIPDVIEQKVLDIVC